MNPVLLNIPVPITTKRLLIRPPMPGDGPELNAAVAESFAELNPWMPWASTLPPVDDSEASARRAYAKWILREDLRLSIYEKGTNRLVGSSGLHRIDWEIRRFEIGYWGRTPDSGRGYITEAVTAIAQFAFAELKARRVEIRSDADNARSLKIPEKLGFQLEARLHSDDTKPHTDHLRDTLIYVRFDANGLPDVAASWDKSEQNQAALKRLNHAQVTIPKTAEDTARDFYCNFLGMSEIEKPENLKGRGGFWMMLDHMQIHVGTEDGVDRHATKAHLAYEVDDLKSWKARLQSRGIDVLDSLPVPGMDRFEFRDPFGNRVEFLQLTT